MGRLIHCCLLLGALFGMVFLNTRNGLAQNASKQAHPRSVTAQSFDQLSQQADTLKDAEKLDEAAKLYRKALALKPTWVEGWWSLGTIDYDSARFAQASEDFRHVLKIKPDDGTTHLMLGLADYELGLYDDSSKHLASAWKLGIQNAPDLEPDLLYHQALLKLRAQQFEGAYDTLGHMFRMSMRDEKATVALGMAALRMTPNELPPAATPAYEVVRRVGIAEATNLTDTYAHARELYQTVLKQTPDFPHIHYAYGRFLANINQPEAAVPEFKAELEHDPKDYNAMLKLASLDYHQDSAAGIPYAEAALKIAPNYPLAHYLLGILSLDTGDIDRAIKELETARKMSPKISQYAFSLANAYTKAHRREDAQREKEAFVRLKAEEKANDSQNYEVKDTAGTPDSGTKQQ